MTTPARILLVDDERPVLSALQRVFRRQGYQVAAFNSAQQALAALETEAPFQLVISDYRMPEMNGVAFLKIVRQRWPEVIRIILSGYAETSAILAATNEGNIFKFIPKPWEETELLEMISEALEQFAIAEQQRRLLRSVDLMKKCLNRGEHDHFKELCVYQTLMDQMPVGLVGISHDNTIMRLNQCAQDRLGLPAELLGKPSAALPEPIYRLIQSNDQNETQAVGRLIALHGKQYLVLTTNFSDADMEGVIMIIVLVPAGVLS